MATKAVKVPFTGAAAPSTPASGDVVVYAKTDKLMYSKDDAGVEAQLSPGAWTSYTPTVGSSGTPPTLGSSTIAGRYQMIAAKTMLLIIEFNVTTGGAWNAGSGIYTFSLPSGVTTTARRQLVVAHFNDQGADRYVGTGIFGASASAVAIVSVWTAAGGTNGYGATTPVTPATGDYVVLHGMIEIA